MRFRLTVKMLIDADAIAGTQPAALTHFDAVARMGFGTFLRPRFDGGVSLRSHTTLDPSDGEDDQQSFPLRLRDALMRARVYTASLEEARDLRGSDAASGSDPLAGRQGTPSAEERRAANTSHEPDGTADTPARGHALITAVLLIDADSAQGVIDEVKPIDDATRLMFYRSLQPLIEGASSLSTLVTVEPTDHDAEVELQRQVGRGRVSRLSTSAQAFRRNDAGASERRT